MEQAARNYSKLGFSIINALWLVGAVSLALAGVIVYDKMFFKVTQYPQSLRKVIIPQAKPLQAFTLVDNKNNNLSVEQLKGHWSFLVFGYTHCPDICPATLSQLTALNRLLSAKAGVEKKPEFVFVSVDPARDTTGVLDNYIQYFNKDFIAATGKARNLESFEDQFGVTHRYDTPDLKGEYAVAHSSEIFLIDPKARIVGHFTPPISTHKVTRQYQDFLSYFRRDTRTL
jgi:protein SCO1/2